MRVMLWRIGTYRDLVSPDCAPIREAHCLPHTMVGREVGKRVTLVLPWCVPG
jgi:hypothetical protein